MPIIPSFIRSLIPSNSQNSQNHSSSNSVSDQDSDIIPPRTVTTQQTFNGQQIPTITEPLSMEPITELSMKPLNAEPKTEPLPPVVAQPMEITPAADALTAPPAEVTEVKRSKSKRLSKNPTKANSEAYDAFWRKLIGITPKSDKGKRRGEGDGAKGA